MSIGVRDRKLLWGKAGNTCAFDGCQQSLIETGEDSSGVDVVTELRPT